MKILCKYNNFSFKSDFPTKAGDTSLHDYFTRITRTEKKWNACALVGLPFHHMRPSLIKESGSGKRAALAWVYEISRP